MRSGWGRRVAPASIVGQPLVPFQTEKNMRRRFVAALSLLAAFTSPLNAQSRTEFVGRVVAVVGDSVVTNIDLQEALLAWQASSGQQPPTDSLELLRLQRDLLDDHVDQLLLLQAAHRDTTLRVQETAITQAVDAQIAQLQQRLGGAAGLERELANSNLTLQSYRDRLAVQQRRQALIQNYLRKIRQQRKPPTVTEEEVRDFFEANSTSVGTRPPTIAFRQVVIPVEPADSAMAIARALADSVLELARGGEDFAQLARRFSEDRGSKDLGGDLGFRRPGAGWYSGFERAVFSPVVRPGEIVGPVRTPVGLHIIKVERIRGAERQARHILIRAAVTDADKERTRKLADSLANEIRGGAEIDTIAARFGDPDELVRVGPFRQDSLPGAYAQHLAGAQRGQVLGPFELNDGPVPQMVVARIIETEAARPATVDDYRTQIIERLADGKLMDELLQELRQATYIEVRLPDPGGGSQR